MKWGKSILSKEINDLDLEIENINVLIDSQEIEAFENALDKLIGQNEFPYKIEESKVFAKRIMKKKTQERYKMNKSMAMASVIVLCIVFGTGIYAKEYLKKFIFHTEHGTAIVKTTENLTENQAKKIVDGLSNSSQIDSTVQDIENLEPTEEYYTTIEEAEEKIGFDLIVPQNIPVQFKQEKGVFVERNDAGKTYAYVHYEPDSDEKYSYLRIDVAKQEYDKGTYVDTIDSMGTETYVASDGTKYMIRREKDEVAKTNCLTAKTYIGQYEYGIFTNGIEDAEFYLILDSMDLTSYKLTQ